MILSTLLAAVALAPRAAQIPPQADAKSFEAILEHVVPAPEELAWRSIPWRPTLADGMRDAAKLDRPVLLWAMNGHPLGST